MVYVFQQELGTQTNSILSALSDPTLIRSARNIYHTYCTANQDLEVLPAGVAISRVTHRGKPTFSDRPILLPQECFVPASQIEAQIH
ncbi:MAG: hypothetical protein H0X31_01970 [Nostocaceae cyanobacterium]|nr:hypothetical protein [Nostocaceae cyanobacterium]